MSAKGKANEKWILSLLTDYVMYITSNRVVMPVLAGWTPKEGLAANVKNEYRGIDLLNETLAVFGINKKRLIMKDKSNMDTIKGLEKAFIEKKIYYFLVAWHIYGIVKNQLPDAIKLSLKKILNLKGNTKLCQEVTRAIFKIFNRDDTFCDFTPLDDINKINEVFLLARDETVIVLGVDKTATRNDKNNSNKRFLHLESIICNEAPIRDKYKTTATCVLISNRAADEIDTSNLFQIHIDNQVVDEEALTQWKFGAGDFYDLNSLLIKHINLVHQSFYDEISECYRIHINSSELKGVFRDSESKGAYIVLKYMLKIYRDAIAAVDENMVIDDSFYDDCIKKVLLSNENYQSSEIDGSSENALFVFKEALIKFIELKSCNIVENNSDDAIDPDKPTIYHDDRYFYVKEHVFKESICPLMGKTISGTKMLNILKSNGFLITNNGSCLSNRVVINGCREYYVTVKRSFIDVRGNISYFD